jgi:hypothetical protein
MRTCFLQMACPGPCPALTPLQRAAEEEAHESVLRAALRRGSLECSALMAATPLYPLAAPWSASCVPAVQGTSYLRPGREQGMRT